MAFERRKRKALAMQTEFTVLTLELTSTGTAVAASAGDVSLVSSITDVGVGEFALVLRQIGKTLVGCSCTPLVATPGAAVPIVCILKTYNAGTKTVTFVLQDSAGTQRDLANGDKVYITLMFNDSSVST